MSVTVHEDPKRRVELSSSYLRLRQLARRANRRLEKSLLPDAREMAEIGRLQAHIAGLEGRNR